MILFLLVLARCAIVALVRCRFNCRVERVGIPCFNLLFRFLCNGNFVGKYEAFPSTVLVLAGLGSWGYRQ